MTERLDALERAVSKQDWLGYIWLHDGPLRLQAFLDIQHEVESKEYWRLLGAIWTSSDNIYECRDLWRDVFEEPARGYGEYFMEQVDRSHIDSPPNKGGLPRTFLVHRGFGMLGAEDGFSWTTDREVACRFAWKFRHSDGSAPWVATGTVGRRDVIGYMTERGEKEIVCLPENVCGIEIQGVSEA